MSEANEEVTEKNQSLFEGCNFRFEGLKSEIEKAFVNLVEVLAYNLFEKILKQAIFSFSYFIFGRIWELKFLMMLKSPLSKNVIS